MGSSENASTVFKVRTLSVANSSPSSAEVGAASRLRSTHKGVGKTASVVELPRRQGVTATMTSTTVTTEVVPPAGSKLSMIQRLMGKKKGPLPAVPDMSQPVVWNNVKLVVVGQENVGKTHLCRQMENVK